MISKPKFSQDFLPVIKQFIFNKVSEAHSDGVVIAVSGGLDSGVVLKLAIDVFKTQKIPDETHKFEDGP